jgi:YtkA-like
MKHLLILFAVPLAGAVLTGCAGETGGSGSAFPAASLMTVPGAQGAVSLEVRTAPAQPPSQGVSSVEYTITAGGEGGERVDGLAISVVPWMPDMGHGTSVVPTVTAEGEGRYVVDDVDLFMSGTWQLRTTITGADEDSAAPTFEIP